ncbi:DNA-methyltransferase [Roseimaritima sediminicola]|uniref:DNA-methyltransferase n=1 Tax=Roseimaritima sediminicola TaxID=2662066 RepID=UPI0012984983|nr:site-specific DNA-methyltransferase [Roseimaritima sediminicola]
MAISKLDRKKPRYETSWGKLFVADSKELLESNRLNWFKGRVQLAFTSPPFPLNTKKKYGNLNGQEYIDWLASYAPLLSDLVADDGSIVIEIGNGWERGSPTMSTLPIEALLEFKKRGNFHLCQEFICYNPARLPSPAQWVTVERCRVKDSYTRVWWMAKTTKPKADNRKVLTGYSDSMKKLLERGTYNAGNRPSQHNIGETSFCTNNGGAIAPNVLLPALDELLPDFLANLPALHGLLPIANTASNDAFSRHCRENNLALHPAKMPPRLVEFFVRLLSDPGDYVFDPFAGSNTTGFVAESLNRKWIACEKDLKYAIASRYRFNDSVKQRKYTKRGAGTT